MSEDECSWGHRWSYVIAVRRSASRFHPLALISRRMYHGAPVITCCILSLVGKGVIRRDAINRFELFHFFSRGKFAMKVDDKDAAGIYVTYGRAYSVLKIYLDIFLKNMWNGCDRWSFVIRCIFSFWITIIGTSSLEGKWRMKVII